MNNDLLTCHRFFEDPLKILYKTHAHDMWEFLFIVKGSPVCMIEGKRYLVKENTLLLFKPAQIHRVQAVVNQPYEYISLMCGVSVLSKNVEEKIANSDGFFTFNDSQSACQRFVDVCAQNKNMSQTCLSESRNGWINSKLEMILDDVTEGVSPTILSEDPIVKKAVSYIEDNVYDISKLCQICDAVGVTKQKLYSCFIRSMLTSPMKYVWAKKAVLAKMELSDKEDHTELLRQYGFSDEAFFQEKYESAYRSVP